MLPVANALAVVAVVAVVALPLNVAVIVPAAKLPEASRATTLEAVFVVVASTAAVTAAEPLNDVPVKYEPSVSVLVVFAVIVMLALPLNDVPLIVRAVCNVVAVAALPVVELEVVALPDNVAVIVPAEKLPEASRNTI